MRQKSKYICDNDKLNKVAKHSVKELLLSAFSECLDGFTGPGDERIKLHPCKVYTYSIDGEVVGVYSIGTFDKNIHTVSVLYIIPSKRRKGYASKLLNFIKADPDIQVLHVAVTEMGDGNAQDLCKFYGKNGFQNVGITEPDSHGIRYYDLCWANFPFHASRRFNGGYRVDRVSSQAEDNKGDTVRRDTTKGTTKGTHGKQRGHTTLFNIPPH